MACGGQHNASGLSFDVLEFAPVGVAVTRGPEQVLVYTNRAYRSLFGDVTLGVSIREAFSALASQDHFLLFDEVYETGEPGGRTDVPGDPTLVTPDGRERFFTFSLSRISFDDGERGVMVMCLEVTDQITTAQRIQALADERIRVLRRYESLVRVSAQILWVSDPQGRVTEHSPGWERVTGQTWEEFRDLGWLQLVHPDDRASATASWSRALGQVPDVWENVQRLRTVAGDYRYFRVQAVPVVEGGRVVEWVGAATDIEEERRQQRRRRLLDRAAAAMAGATSLEEMLGALADVIVPELADGCGVHLVTDLADGLTDRPSLVVDRVATAAAPGVPRVPSYGAQRLTSEGGFVRAVQEARPLLATFPAGAPPDDLGPPATMRWLRESRANCLAILPVLVDGTVTALVTVSTCGERPPIEQDDLDLLRRTFEQANDALRNVMRFQRARQIAFAMQHSLLAEPPRVPGLIITARYRPAQAAAEVGGDWYDSFQLPGGATVLAIGDVAGHDLRAAVAMGQLRNMLRGLAVDRQEPPGEILARLNTATGTLYGEDTATCVLARVERQDDGFELHYSVAGHPPPLVTTPDGEARFLEEAVNPLLGIPHQHAFLSAREPLPERGTLLFYTDGLVELPGEDLDDGLARLRDLAASLADAPLDQFCDELLGRMPVSEQDDIAMIALRLSGEE
ncbi:SpoIIE family protein phosphatase [Nonomuraea sp. NPDC048826]|uniref:SpoIIE family protein phosphatase n=1 Tax=Nonomuraea sp. NPDC048826 TaxID=3364347 RepID=UPI00371DBC47